MEAAPPTKINITIPLLPPTVNHYWKHTVRHGQYRTYVSAAGKAFKRAVATAAIGKTVIPGGATTHALTKVRCARKRGPKKKTDQSGG